MKKVAVFKKDNASLAPGQMEAALRRTRVQRRVAHGGGQGADAGAGLR